MTLWVMMIKHTHPGWCWLCVCMRVCADKEELCLDSLEHQELRADISPYQRPLIAPSTPEQIQHKCIRTFRKPPSCRVCALHLLLFFPCYSQEYVCTCRTYSGHAYTHRSALYCTWWHKHLSSEHLHHACEADCETLASGVIYAFTKLFLDGLSHISRWHRGTVCILELLLLHWKGLSWWTVKGLAFCLHHNKPISQGCTLSLCFLHNIWFSLMVFFCFFLPNRRLAQF